MPNSLQPQHPRHLSSSSSSSSSFASYGLHPAGLGIRPSDGSTTDFCPSFDLDSSSDSSIRKPVSAASAPSPSQDRAENSAENIVEKSVYVSKQNGVAQSRWVEDITQDERDGIPTSRAFYVQNRVTAELTPIISSLGISQNVGSKGHVKPGDATWADFDSARPQELRSSPVRASALASSKMTEGIAMKQRPVHQSETKGRVQDDRLSRYVAESPASGDCRVRLCKSFPDAGIGSPSPPASWATKQDVTRSPRSPDPLLSYDSVRTIHTVKPTPSKWDDAEKWLNSPPSHQKIANTTCSNSQGCGGFGAHTLHRLGKSSNPATLSATAAAPQKHPAEAHQNIISSRHLVSQQPDFQRLQQRSNRRIKHRNAPPSPSEIHTEMRRSFETERLAWTDSIAIPSCAGNPKSEGIRHSPQGARLLATDYPAVRSDTTFLIDRTRRECPSSGPVMEKQTCLNCSHRCAQCGSSFTDLASIGGFHALDQNKLANGRKTSSDAALQQLSSVKDGELVSIVLKDAGTQMTPAERSSNATKYSSKCPSPARHNTPARPSRSPSLTARNSGLDLAELAHCHRAKLELQGLSEGERIYSFHRKHSNWSSRDVEEEEIGKSLRQLALDEYCDDSAATEPSALLSSRRKDERSKIARLKREEARILAWENHKKAKADVQLRKLEAKLEKRRAQTTDKIMCKLTAAQRQAQKMRSEIRGHQTGSTPKPLNEFLQMHLCACFIPSLLHPCP